MEGGKWNGERGKWRVEREDTSGDGRLRIESCPALKLEIGPFGPAQGRDWRLDQLDVTLNLVYYV